MPPTYVWLLSEDNALKSKLQGITVVDTNNQTRSVPVYFREPQKEVREEVYPYIAIFFSGISRAVEREQRGEFIPGLEYEFYGYTPDGDPNTWLIADTPIPVNLIYNVAVMSRNPLHDRQLIAALLQPDYLPMRFGYLEIDDNTTRRLDLVGIDSADMRGSDGFPMFRKVFTVLVSSELLSAPLGDATRVVSTTQVTLKAIQANGLAEVQETFAG